MCINWPSKEELLHQEFWLVETRSKWTSLFYLTCSVKQNVFKNLTTCLVRRTYRATGKNPYFLQGTVSNLGLRKYWTFTVSHLLILDVTASRYLVLVRFFYKTDLLWLSHCFLIRSSNLILNITNKEVLLCMMTCWFAYIYMTDRETIQ